jgi:hypothetical protein
MTSEGTPRLQDIASPVSVLTEAILPPLEKPPTLPHVPTKTLPSVASLLNSPIKEISPRQPWPEPLAPTPLPPQTSFIPLPMPDIEHESGRMRSPSNISEMSRSQSQGEYFGRPYPGDRFYPDDPRAQSMPPRYIPSPQPNLLPPVRLHEQSQFYPSPRYEPMPPPAAITHEASFVRETYSRSPVQPRPLPGAPSPLPPPLPPPTRDYYDRRPNDPPYYREPYFEREERDYPRYEDERYRYERSQNDHARERMMAQDREWREYPESYRGYRPRSPEYRGDYDNWRRLQEEYERERMERMERDRLDRERFERERWARRN